MVTMTVHTPRPVVAPRGATLAANLMARVLDWLEAAGRAHATAVARRREGKRITEAAELRRYAQSWVGHDPRFAADLLAAADRHDRAE